jgi:hypothetical protein
MSISSTAFGRVLLTGKDADKFRSQVRYGRANTASKSAVSEGVKLAKQLSTNGSVTFKLPKKPSSK